MGDQAKFSDDISALWGPDDTGVLDPVPLGRGDQPANGNGNGTHADDRLARLEAHVDALAGAIEALRGEVLAKVDLGLAGRDRRLTAVERDIESIRAARPERDVQDEFARELLAVRAAAEQEATRRIAELETRLQQRLHDLAGRAPAPDAPERLAALERRAGLLAESLDAYRREAIREPHLEPIRADLQAAADEIAARTHDHVTQHLHELGAHLAAQLAALDQRIARQGDLLDSHRVQSVMGWELESLRTELIGAVTAELAALRAELTPHDQAEDDRRRLEASWQQVMPGF